MNEETIKQLLKENKLKKKQIDIEKIKSLLSSAEENAEVVKKIELNDKTATVIFRELYESVRQLGESMWLLKGYEPSDHQISLESLKDLEIKQKLKLNYLDRYRLIRHDANYKGFKIPKEQAQEMKDFWDSCGKEIIDIILKKIQN